MKILLINPSSYYYQGSTDIRLSLPLGIMYVAAAIEEALPSVRVSIFDCHISSNTYVEATENEIFHGVPDEYFMAVISKEDPDIVGISCNFTSQFDNYLHASQLVKEVNSNIVVVGGGAHFAVCGEDFLLNRTGTDCYVTGEGEVPMVEIIKSIEGGDSLKDIPGVTYTEEGLEGRKVVQSSNTLIRQMDDITRPAYHLIDMDLFFHYQANGCKGYSQPMSTRPDRDGKRSVSMITSRGCPYKCTFCSIALHMGKPVRAHGPEYVVEHLDHLVKIYGIQHVFFEDDNLTFRLERTQAICKLMIERGIDISWSTPNGVRADKLDYGLLTIMKKAGCNGLVVGTESGDQETITNIVKKDLKLETIIQVAKWCKELDIPLGQFLIIGFPGETKKKIQKTIDFAVEMYEQYNVQPLLNIATPLIGTELYETVINHGLLAKELTPKNLSEATQSDSGQCMIKTDEFTPQDISEFSVQLDRRISRVRIKKALTNFEEYMRLIKAVIFQPGKIIGYVRRIF